MTTLNTKYKVGDHVRISKLRGVFDKHYKPNWSTKIFTIKKVLQLQRVKHPDIYLVEKVLKRQGNRVFVKWLGFDNKHNSWIDKNNIQ